MQLEPYLFFDGHCEAAMEYYKSIFGGELDVNRYGGSPIEAQMPPGYAEKIMHATLRADGFSVMAADRPGAIKTGAPQNISLSFATSDDKQGNAVFDKLAAGGSVRMALAPAFWGGTFGMLTDRFGVDWMVSIHQG